MYCGLSSGEFDHRVAIQHLENLQRAAYLRIGVDPAEISKKRKEIFLEVLEAELKQKEKLLSQQELEKYRELRTKKFELTVRQSLLTKYEDPIFYSLMEGYSADIEKGIKIWKSLPDKIKQYIDDFPDKKSSAIFGTIPMGTVNAMSISVRKSDDFVVVFESDLFNYCLLMSKIVARCMSYTGQKDSRSVFSTDEENIMKTIENSDEILSRFQDLVFAYLFRGSPGTASRYLIEPPYDKIVQNLINSMELFVLGHEYAHILAGHIGKKIRPNAAFLGNDDDELMIYQQKQEIEADMVGLILSLGAMKVRGYDFSLSYWGAELFFSCDEIIERGRSILQTGTDEWYWCGGKKGGPLGTHPPAEIRRECIRKFMTEVGETNPVKLGELVEKILTRLWEKTRPILVQHYLNNAKLHPKWQQQISNV